MFSNSSWPVPPPGGWRPSQAKDQLALILASLVAVAVVVDLLLAIWLLYRPWGETAGFARRLLVWAAVPINGLGAAAVVVWAWLR
jgi:hypothetical protein